jgi:predicted metal-dependent enzyme (double-stranded beta helix superfamily)
MTSPTDAYSVDQFMADARATYARLGSTDAGRQALGTILQRLARASDLMPQEELAALHGGEATATLLASDGPESLTLMLARFTTPTSVHDHGSWGVACVVQGRDRYQQWERLDDGSDATHAEVRMQTEQDLGPGDVVTWSGPPHDLHAQQGVDGPAWELVLFGRNVTQLPRRYFDPVSGAVRTALPQ